MFEADFPRVVQIDRLLAARNHAALEACTLEQLPHGLLGEDTLNAARLLRLPAAVMYLATLAAENLRPAHRARAWLAVYQSIARGGFTDGFAALPARLPLKVVASAIVTGQPVDAAALHKAHGGIDEWLRCAELCVDHTRFDALEAVVRALVQQRIAIEDWLRLVKVLFNRHPYIFKTVDTDLLGRCYLRIRDNLLARLPSIATVRSRLALFATASHFYAGNYPAAIEAAQLATTQGDRLHAAFDIARAYCHRGDLDASLLWLDRLVELMTEAPLTEPTAPVERPTAEDEPEPDKEKRNTFDPVQASSALLDLQNALAPVGQKAFLVSGTLLGYHREGALLAHDKDIDVGIVGWQDQYDIAAALLRSGRFALDTRRLRGHKAYHLPVKHLQTRVSIDIFIYHEEDGKWVTGVESYFGYLQKFAFTPFEIRQVEFLGIGFHVPGDIERNLAENFGDWRQSDPDYISHLQSPSTVDVGGKVFQIVGRIRALEAIRGAKHEKLRRVVRIMTEQRHRPGGMSAQTLARLQQVLDGTTLAEVA